MDNVFTWILVLIFLGAIGALKDVDFSLGFNEKSDDECPYDHD